MDSEHVVDYSDDHGEHAVDSSVTAAALPPPPLVPSGSTSTSTRSSAYAASPRAVSSNDLSSLIRPYDDDGLGVVGGTAAIVGAAITADKAVVAPVPRLPSAWSESSSYDGSPSSRAPYSPDDDLRLTSEDDTDADADNDNDNDDFFLDPRTAAIVVAEEGRGLIVHGEGMSVASLNIQPGTTHLLLSSLANPNSLPALLGQVLPAISGTLLALDISANFLGALPPALAACSQLTELNVASNPLRVLPVWLARLTALRVLIADATGLSNLPRELAALSALNILSLRRNRLMSLPPWLAHFPALSRLSVEGNPFQGPWAALLAPLNSPAGASSASASTSQASTSSSHATTGSPYTNGSPYASTASMHSYPNTGSMYTTSLYASTPSTPLPPAEDEDPTIMPGASNGFIASGGLGTPNTSGPPIASPTLLPYMRSPSAASPLFPPTPAPAPAPPSPLLRTRTTPSRPEWRGSVLTERGSASIRPRTSSDASRSRTPSEAFRPRTPSDALRSRTPSDALRSRTPSDALRPRTSSDSPFSRTTTDAPRPRTDYEDSGYYGSTYLRRSDGSEREFYAHNGDARTEDEDVERNREMRRMRSADELRRALESVIGPSEPRAPPPPPREELRAPRVDVAQDPPFFVAKLESGNARHTLADRRFASVGPSVRPRPALSDAWDAADTGKPRKWGFLKKMSMGRMRSETAAPALRTSPPRKSPPRIVEGHVAPASTPAPAPAPASTPAPAPARPPPLSASPAFLAPPRSAKRRSFLPLDDAPASAHAAPAAASTPSLTLPLPPAELFQSPAETQADTDARVLRGVMAYLRDMADLGMAASTEPPAAAATERTQNTMSVVTTDSSGSGREEERRDLHKDDATKRALIVREIVETERTYVKGLRELIDIYVKPASQPVTTLGNAVAGTKETVVPAAERKIVFNGLDALFSFHTQSFLPALERAARTRAEPDDGAFSAAMALANVFVSHAAFMRMYSTYINNFDNAVHRLKQWSTERRLTTSTSVPGSSAASPSSSTLHLAGMALQMSGVPVAGVGDGETIALSTSQRKRIKSYLKRCRLHPQHSQLNLEGYLLLPVQRIPRYRLLLEELVRCTPPKIDAYDDLLDRALTEISSLAANMNEGKRDAESRRKLVQWQTRIRGKFPSPLVQPHRRLIMDGGLHLTRVVRKSAMAFDVINSSGDKTNVQVECLAPEETPRSLVGILCNDLLVLCKDPSAGKDHIGPVDLWAVLRMQTLPQPASIVHGSALRVVDNKAILYFDAPSTSEALTWCRAINIHIPASKI